MTDMIEVEGRKVQEWIGKTPDSKPPPKVRIRCFKRAGGKCHISGRKITAADKWELDHITALVNGGENRERNLAPALKAEHRKKTNADVAQKAKDTRIRQKHLGIKAESPWPVPGGKKSKFKRKVGGGVVRRDEE